MKEIIFRLEDLLAKGKKFLENMPLEQIEHKVSESKWSGKEILGHLVDSGINNLVRFVEISSGEMPYRLKEYDQDAWVRTSDYQNTPLPEVLELWLLVNRQILRVIKGQKEETMVKEVLLSSGRTIDFRFLINDYTDHMEHHLKQVMR
ncbi:DinB family protein [Sinomicrobium sp. M5D2P17]